VKCSSQYGVTQYEKMSDQMAQVWENLKCLSRGNGGGGEREKKGEKKDLQGTQVQGNAWGGGQTTPVGKRGSKKGPVGCWGVKNGWASNRDSGEGFRKKTEEEATDFGVGGGRGGVSVAKKE